MEGQSTNPRCRGGEDRSLCTNLAPIYATRRRGFSAGVSGPGALLDDSRSREKTAEVLGLLQQSENPPRFERCHAHRESWQADTGGRRSKQFPMAFTLSRLAPSARRCLNVTSPHTRYESIYLTSFDFCRATSAIGVRTRN